MPFEENSYLGKQIEKMRNDFLKTNADIINEFNDLNKDLNKILYNIRYTEEFEKDNILLGLFCNTIETFNSIVILSNYGLSSNSQVLLRSLIESVFNYCAIIRDESHFDFFIERGNAETRRLARLIENNPNTFKNGELKDQIGKLKLDSDLFNKKYDFKSIEDISKSAKLHDLYLYTYNILCLETHSNVKSIVRNHIDYKEENVTLNMLPEYENHKFLVVTTMYVLVQFLVGTQEYFDCDLTMIIDRYFNYVKDFDSK